MERTRRIVVGVDFSVHSESALGQAGRLAALSGAPLSVVHVIEGLVLENLALATRTPELTVREAVTSGERLRLERLVARVVPAGVETSLEVRVGAPFEEILLCVGNTSADLLVMGTHGSSSPDGPAGSLATKCVRKASCDVLLVRGIHPGPFHHIVACTDFSETSGLGLRQAARIARRDNATLVILHTFVPPWSVYHYRAPTSEASPDFEIAFRRSLDTLMARFLEPFAADLAGLPVERKILESLSPGAGIVEFLSEHRADLAVVGTRGRSAFVMFLMGTTAERIVRDSPCSVLAVKPASVHNDSG